MWPLWLIITVAVAGAAVLTSTGVLLAITLERRRHRKILQANGLTRGLTNYHRPKLSANEVNYSHVTAPNAHLRRSVQTPYGIVPIRQVSGTRDDEEKRSDMAEGGVGKSTELLLPRPAGSIRRSFNGQPLCIPKGRQSSKQRKTIPLQVLPKSPLSAISEFSDPLSSAPPDASEFPTQQTTVPMERPIPGPGKHVSTQWPLAITNTSSSSITPTEIMEIAARESVLLRKGGGSQNTVVNATTSLAPEEPLPPLPSHNARRRPDAQESAVRTSNASLNTIGSSVLGTFMSSPNNTRDYSASHAIDHQSPKFDLALKQEFSTPKLQVPPVKKTIHGLVTGKSIRSLHPTVDIDEPSPCTVEWPPPQLPAAIGRESSFKTIDARIWALPPLNVNKIRGQAGQNNRHSMVEHWKLAQWRVVSDSTTGLQADDDVFAIGEALKRPNSVATGNPLQWHCHGVVPNKPHSLSSLDGPKRGHKRQNCVRITNLPIVDMKAGMMRLPEVREEQHSSSLSGAHSDEQSNGDYQMKLPEPIFRPAPPAMNIKSTPTPSPFKNIPILTPTPRPVRKQYIKPPLGRALKVHKPSDTPRPDSEIFDSNRGETPTSTRFTNSPHEWPLSIASNDAFNLTDTPPSAKKSERTPMESPILPSPAFNSSSIYPRKSLVKGPRSPRNSSQSSRAVSASPLQKKHGYGYRVSKDRDSNGDLNLNKSALMLTHMNSQAQLLGQQQSSGQIHHSREKLSPEILALPSPPINKRIMGLRTSSCASSMAGAAAPSPTHERQPISRGPSPLALASNSAQYKANRTKSIISGAGGMRSFPSPTLDVPGSHMSASPSIVSISGASIWEDASVRADSPEMEEEQPHDSSGNPHIAPLALRTLPKTDQNQRHLYPSRSSSRAHQLTQQQQDVFPIVTRDFGSNGMDAQHLDNNPSSHLVQQLERAVSTGHWDHQIHKSSRYSGVNHGFSGTENVIVDTLTPCTRREMDVFGVAAHSQDRIKNNISRSRKEPGVGLGLRLDSLIVGNPHTSGLNR